MAVSMVLVWYTQTQCIPLVEDSHIQFMVGSIIGIVCCCSTCAFSVYDEGSLIWIDLNVDVESIYTLYIQHESFL